MTSVERTFSVAAPAAAVLAYLSDFGNTEQWDPATQKTVRTDAGPIAPGATWVNTSKVFGRESEITYTLRSLDGDTIVFVGENKTLTSVDTITVRSTGPGSEITYHVDLDLHGIAVLAAPVMKLEFEKLARETVKKMTEVLARL
ncbi:SRPBCC family protein [Paractinoplanes durhamensis]|uniref:Polyketide cyclase n=1 Tax=Paractinoplanes durhamensis TaxID=113563 RepID=A0ABQ3YXH2_9ACTN|nr:SRPBCC family protein [Actinoplanes durhamensis]GIE02214.1 polyketide cyclase [Actinoplanes durhamensis]